MPTHPPNHTSACTREPDLNSPLPPPAHSTTRHHRLAAFLLAPALPAATTRVQELRTTGPRAYSQALAFYALTFGVYAVTAILDGAAAWGFHPAWSDAVNHWAPLACWSTLAGLTLGLAATQGCRLVWAWTAGLITLLSADAILTGGAMRTPDGLYALASAVAATLLALVFAHQHGLSPLGFGFGRRWAGPHDPIGRHQAYTVFWWATAGSLTSSILGIGLIAVGLPHGHPPIGSHEPPLGVILRILSAGVAEEVLAAVVVIALSAARRPTWEIYTVPVLMRVSYHMYYQAVGPVALAMGLVYVWLYRRTRRLTPIICAHITLDAMAWMHQLGTIPTIAAIAACYLACLLLEKFWLKTPARADKTGQVT